MTSPVFCKLSIPYMSLHVWHGRCVNVGYGGSNFLLDHPKSNRSVLQHKTALAQGAINIIKLIMRVQPFLVAYIVEAL